MRIRATCDACERDFLFFELRDTGRGVADRCPSCQRLLGVRGLLAVRVEQALAILVGSLEELARQHPNFTVRPQSVLKPVEDALATVAPRPAAETPARQHRKSLRAAA